MSGWELPAPVGVRETPNDWIVMPDGVRLAVSLWLPEQDAPAPVVLEYIPYRKRDSTHAYARWWGRQLARYGVGYARLDARGSGDSEGLLVDEYLPQEQDDAVHAIAWLAAQSWCNGAVGMRGVSWGGFSTLQAAALAPPALKAIMPMCASDRRYTDDAHYVGGTFALTGLKWATSFKLVMAGPPDPAVTGPGWEDAWLARLEAAPPIAAQWLAHQREDDYWRQGSVAFDYGAIKCPVYLVGGWADPYNAAIPRLLEGLNVPAKAVIGPWGHGYPAPAAPGPGLDWIFEEARWWRHWLLGEATGIMDGPRVWAFMPEASPAEVAPGRIPGRWVAADWPWATETLTLRLSPGRLSASEGQTATLQLVSDPRVGLETPEWCPFAPAQYPQEQSPDDERSLRFDSEPLEAPLEILGAPTLRLHVASDRSVAKLAARLTEITPDGRSWLVTYGVLNLTHRNGHAAPEPLEPGAVYAIELPLYPIARRFRAGSRLRLALSEGLWPLVWPSPEPVTLRLELAGATLTLPVRAAGRDEPAFPIPLEARAAAGNRGVDPLIMRRASPEERVTLRDGRLLHINARVAFTEMSAPSHTLVEAAGVTVTRAGPDLDLSVDVLDPANCKWRVRQHVGYRRDDWRCELRSEVELQADRGAFRVREALVAFRDGAIVFNREQTTEIPRDLM